MTNKFFEYYKELPGWAKGVVFIGGIGVVYIFSSQIIKKIKKDAEQRKAMEDIVTQKGELKNLLGTGMRLSYPISQYTAWANSLESQFSGCDVSIVTYVAPSFLSYSGKKLYSVIDALKNDADMLQLQVSWGIREYDACGLWNGNVKGTLSYCVNDELDEVEVKAINTLLTKKGIKYQF